MKCRYFDEKTQMCKKSTQWVPCNHDMITQYCRGNYNRCDIYYGNKFAWSGDIAERNKKAYKHGSKMRAIAPLVFFGTIAVGMFNGMSFGEVIALAVILALLVGMVTSKHN